MFDGWREDDLVLEETDLELDSTNKFLENQTSLDQVDSRPPLWHLHSVAHDWAYTDWADGCRHREFVQVEAEQEADERMILFEWRLT